MVNVCARMNDRIMCCGENKKPPPKKREMYWESRARNGLRRPSVREKEERRDGLRDRQRKRGRKRDKGGLTNWKQHVDLLTRVARQTKKKKKETEGESDRDRKREWKTASPREWQSAVLRGRVCGWMWEQHIANASVNLNLWLTPLGPTLPQSPLAFPVRM